MARRQKGRSGKAAAPAADEDELVRRGASVKAIRTWDDAEHESADEFEAGKDRVLVGFDRRQRQGRGAGSGDDGAAGESDEEVLGVRAAASSGDDSDNDAGEAFYSDEDDEGPGGQAEDGAWGKQKYNYYDADDIGTDTDDDDAAAQEEEEEALRLQRKRLEALDEGDFIDEFSAQLGVGAKGADGISRLVSSVEDGSEQAQTQAAPGELGADGSYSMSEAKRQALLRLPEKERVKVLQAESPELLSLADDMKTYWAVVRDEVRPVLDRAAALGVRPDEHPALAFYTAQYQLLTSYLNNIAVYLVLKASTPEERGEIALRDHPVIAGIVEFRRRLELMDALQARLGPLLALFSEELASGEIGASAETDGDAAMVVDVASEDEAARSRTAKQPKAPAAARRKSRTAAAPGTFLEATAAGPAGDSYAELQAMLKKGRRKKDAARRAAAGTDWAALEDGDLGDQEQLEAEDAEDKERAMRRLRHHAQRIVQARGKRDARDKMSGDMDVPYRDRRAERLRYDDQAISAVRAKAKKHGDDLDMGMDLDSDVGEAADRADGDLYGDEVRRQAQKKAVKAERREATWRQTVAGNVAEEAAVKGDGKRSVNYQILKNKGLQPRRTKEQRNPRVKRRARYEKAKKKLGSSVAQVRALDGSYGGEATGIKPRLTRSTRFG